MNFKFLLLNIILSSVILIGVSCKAPRNNPLDPLNPDYNYGTLEGTVQTTGTSSVGIDNVSIVWENANLMTNTDANGRFRLNNIPIKDGNLIFSKTGYKPDTLEIVWGSAKRYVSLTFLNRIPLLDAISFYSIVKNDGTSNPICELFVKAWVTDHDDDIDTVLLFNSNLNLRKSLPFISNEGVYQSTINQQELNVDDIEQTIGSDFFILAVDDNKNEFNLGSARIARVIKNEITGLQPSDNDTVSAQPVFLWNEFNAGYDFTYSIEVFKTDLVNPQLVHSETGIPSDSVSYSFSGNLANGNYYWVIWIIDQFQNRSRSKPSTFRIQN